MSKGRKDGDRSSRTSGAPTRDLNREAPETPGRHDATVDARPEEAHRAKAAVDKGRLDDTGVADAGSPGRSAAAARSLPRIPRAYYSVEQEIARGGLGRILRAHDKRLDREVALKEALQGDDSATLRFVREMKLTARLQHPNIVPIHEAGSWPDGELFYAMKLVNGQSLSQAILSKRSYAERMTLLPHVRDVADAMAYAHSEGIIHRDLKPSNVLVGPFGETALIDWGLAKEIGDTSDEEAPAPRQPRPPRNAPRGVFDTSDGIVVGTPAYMPPEQATGEHVDERADVYALGAMLYHLVTGLRPYSDVQRGKVLDAVANEAPEPVEDIVPEVPRDLLAIIRKAMAREPSERYADANEMADELRRYSTGKLVGAYDYTLWELVQRFFQRQRAAVLTAGMGVALLLAFAGWSFANISARADTEAHLRVVAEEAAALATSAREKSVHRINELTLEKATALLDKDPTLSLAWLLTFERRAGAGAGGGSGSGGPRRRSTDLRGSHRWHRVGVHFRRRIPHRLCEHGRDGEDLGRGRRRPPEAGGAQRPDPVGDIRPGVGPGQRELRRVGPDLGRHHRRWKHPAGPRRTGEGGCLRPRREDPGQRGRRRPGAGVASG